FRIEIHPQREIQPTATRLRRKSISIDNEKLRVWCPPGERRWSTGASAALCRAVHQLPTVSADLVRGNAAGERRRCPIAKAIADQFIARATGRCTLWLQRLEIEDNAVNAHLQ